MSTSPDSRVTHTTYHGRFAPTPSGPLHLGSLFTALASWLDARAHAGTWRVRIDDLDHARCIRSADSLILRQLEQHGLEWDEAPRYQSQHVDAYRATLNRLIQNQQTYPCSCRRSELLAESLPGPDDAVYAGYCRTQPRRSGCATALRFRTPPGVVSLDDLWSGVQQRDSGQQIGDFILQRRDGLIGYQLACVVDEVQWGITHVVRGYDLLGSSFRQCLLMDALNLPQPRYGHLPVLRLADGRKLSKQNHAPALTADQASRNLWRCLQLLGQQPHPALLDETPANILHWAVAHWQRPNITTSHEHTVEE